MSSYRSNWACVDAAITRLRAMKAFATSPIGYVSILAPVLGVSLVFATVSLAGPTQTPTASPSTTPSATPSEAAPPPAGSTPTPTPAEADPLLSASEPTSTPTTASTIDEDPGRIVQILQSGKSVDVLVAFEASAISAEARNRAAANGRRYLGPDELSYKRDAFATLKHKGLEGLQGITILHDYENLPSSFVRILNETALESLLARPEVKAVRRPTKLRPALDQSLPLIGHEWVAGQGLDGSGTVVAVFDTGVDYTISPFNCTSPGEPSGCRVLATRESTNIDPFYEDDGSLDDLGHGTQVSTIVASVAGDTNLVVADVCHSVYGCDDFFVGDAIDWVIGLKETINIVAINISVGSTSPYSDYCNFFPLKDKLDAARDAGIQPVVASGNYAYSYGFFRIGVNFPACIEGVVSVGAVYDANDIGNFEWQDPLYQYYCQDTTTAADQVTCFSQTADFLDLLAPGALIASSGEPDAGTSFAAPHVSGAWAVMREYYDDPNTTSNEDILAILKNSGTGVTDVRTEFEPGGPWETPRLNFVPEPGQFTVLNSGIISVLALYFLRTRNRNLGKQSSRVGFHS